MDKPEVTGFFDPRTFSIQYVVVDPDTHRCAIIDPVHDYDEKSGQTATKNADRILDFIDSKSYAVESILAPGLSGRRRSSATLVFSPRSVRMRSPIIPECPCPPRQCSRIAPPLSSVSCIRTARPGHVLLLSPSGAPKS